MRTVTRAISAALALSTFGPLPAAAQAGGPRARFTLGGSAVWEESKVSGFDVRRTGVLLDGRGTLAAGPLQLSLDYRQGSLGTANPVNDRTLVEGRALLGLRLARWVLIELGPLARAYITPGGTERWLLWEGNARFEAQVLGPSVRTYAVLSRVLGSNLAAFGNGQAGAAGLTVRLGRSPLSAQLGYWVNQANLSGGLRVETLQGVSVALGLTLR